MKLLFLGRIIGLGAFFLHGEHQVKGKGNCFTTFGKESLKHTTCTSTSTSSVIRSKSVVPNTTTCVPLASNRVTAADRISNLERNMAEIRSSLELLCKLLERQP
ncbi:hypothetical protein GEMRC1_006396 [Eukaryota sp. GEM-RC1]